MHRCRDAWVQAHTDAWTQMLGHVESQVHVDTGMH